MERPANKRLRGAWSTSKGTEARAAADQALARARAIQRAEYQARCHEWLGRFDRDAEEIPSASAHWQQALTIYETLQMPDQIARIKTHLASLQ